MKLGDAELNASADPAVFFLRGAVFFRAVFAVFFVAMFWPPASEAMTAGPPSQTNGPPGGASRNAGYGALILRVSAASTTATSRTPSRDSKSVTR